MFIGNKENFKECMDKIKILNPKENKTYRVSFMYMLRSLLLIIVLLIIIIYSSKAFIHPLKDNNLISIFLILFLISYICFNLYTVLGYNIKVNEKTVENKKIKLSKLSNLLYTEANLIYATSSISNKFSIIIEPNS